jgi:predicted TIM-barrel fold metal-dependent hydrolase
MDEIRRRSFLAGAAFGTAAGMTPNAADAPREVKGSPAMTPPDLCAIPNFCSHEHWGSINCIGMKPEGFRADTEAGALPSRRAGIWDIVLDPYLSGWIGTQGTDPAALARENGYDNLLSWWHVDAAAALKALEPHLRRQQLSGAFLCQRRGIQQLHGADIGAFETEVWEEADRRIADTYGDLFGWYRKAMKSAGFSQVIRPVHPEFYVRQQSSNTAAEELAFASTILRIDGLMDCWPETCPRRDGLAEITGVDPRGAASWRDFLDALFRLAATEGAAGIKQLQAYSRSLNFRTRQDSEVRFRGSLNPEEVTLFQDWLMHECCARADARGWPHQIHVGTHNLAESSPLPLEALARRYPRMKLVMLHCWPFCDESAFLAKYCHNVYIDTCWQPVLNPEFFRRAMTQWLNFVPHHKIMCAHDATSIEMAAGSALFTREILADILAEQAAPYLAGEDALRRTAAGFLHNNAVDVYGIGKKV